MLKYNITKMAYTDVGQAAALISRAMNPDEGRWARKTMEYHFQCGSYGINDGRSYFAWRVAGEIAGLVGLCHEVSGPEQNVWLSWFAVAPELQRQGHGGGLLKAIEALAVSRGYKKFFVETYSSTDFTKARNFYESHGFAQVGFVVDYLGGGVDMIVYGKELNHAR